MAQTTDGVEAERTSAPHLGARVRTWDGNVGKVRGVLLGGWFAVHIDGEYTVHGNERTDEWPTAALTVLTAVA